MKPPYLIQRLNKTYHDFVPFDRGVGVGGSNESRKLIKGFVGHDYMGSAEFEFGTLPKAYEALGHGVGYVKFKVKLRGITLYGFGPKADIPEIISFLKEDAKGNTRLKENTYLQYLVNPNSELKSLGEGVKGWFDLENLWMAFVDQEMFNRFTKFYAIDKWVEEK